MVLFIRANLAANGILLRSCITRAARVRACVLCSMGVTCGRGSRQYQVGCPRAWRGVGDSASSRAALWPVPGVRCTFGWMLCYRVCLGEKQASAAALLKSAQRTKQQEWIGNSSRRLQQENNAAGRYVFSKTTNSNVAIARSSSAQGMMDSCAATMSTALLICRCRTSRFVLWCGGCLILLRRRWATDGGVRVCSSASKNKEEVLRSLLRHDDDLLDVCLH
jgi:hypothetical protein